jgi:hypothetical protein
LTPRPRQRSKALSRCRGRRYRGSRTVSRCPRYHSDTSTFGLVLKDEDQAPYRPDHCNDRRYCGRQTSCGWFVSVHWKFGVCSYSSLKRQPAGSDRRACSRGLESGASANIHATRSGIGPHGLVAAAAYEEGRATPIAAVTEVPAVIAAMATHVHPTAAVTTATTVTGSSRSEGCEAQGTCSDNCKSNLAKHRGLHLCETRHRVCCSAPWDATGEIWFMRYRPF